MVGHLRGGGGGIVLLIFFIQEKVLNSLITTESIRTYCCIYE